MHRFTHKELALFLAPLLVLAVFFGVLRLPQAWRRAQLARIPGLIAVLPTDGLASGAIFSPDGSRIITGESRQNMRRGSNDVSRLVVWNARNGEELRRIGGALPASPALLPEAIAPDGKAIVAWDLANAHRVYEVATGKQLDQFGTRLNDPVPFHKRYTPEIHEADFAFLASVAGRKRNFLQRAFSDDGSLFAAAVDIGTSETHEVLRAWRVADRHLLWSVDMAGMRHLLFSSDDRMLLAHGNLGLNAFDAKTGKLLWNSKLFSNNDQCAVSPDGRLVAGRGGSYHGIEFVSAADGHSLRQSDYPAAIPITMLSSMLFSPDGKTLLTSGEREFYLWNVETLLSPELAH